MNIVQRLEFIDFFEINKKYKDFILYYNDEFIEKPHIKEIIKKLYKCSLQTITIKPIVSKMIKDNSYTIIAGAKTQISFK